MSNKIQEIYKPIFKVTYFPDKNPTYIYVQASSISEAAELATELHASWAIGSIEKVSSYLLCSKD